MSCCMGPQVLDVCAPRGCRSRQAEPSDATQPQPEIGSNPVARDPAGRGGLASPGRLACAPRFAAKGSHAPCLLRVSSGGPFWLSTENLSRPASQACTRTGPAYGEPTKRSTCRLAAHSPSLLPVRSLHTRHGDVHASAHKAREG